MNRRRVICRTKIGRFTSELAGVGVYDTLADLDIPKQRPLGGGNRWWLPRCRLDDALVELELRHFDVVIVDAQDTLW